MAELGISVYSEHPTAGRDQAYIGRAGSLRCRGIFTCLLNVRDKSREQVVNEFCLLANTAHECGMEIIPDVSPTIFSKMGISYEDLSVFQDIHMDGTRLDKGSDGMKESLVTYNPQGLKIELNTNTQLVYVENIMSHHPNRSKLATCHNFYLQQYSELSLEHFNKYNEEMKSMYLPVTASISSNNEGAYGPWPVSGGLCTLGMHRGLPIGFQARHLSATGIMDDILITNAYASAEELEACTAVNPSILIFGLALEKELTRTEQKVLDYEPKHVIRGDMSEYMIRSTWSKVTFADESIPTANTQDLERGDAVIPNDGYLRYKGELHIVSKDMPNDGRRSVIGHLPEYEHVLLNYVEPWKVFAFCKA